MEVADRFGFLPGLQCSRCLAGLELRVTAQTAVALQSWGSDTILEICGWRLPDRPLPPLLECHGSSLRLCLPDRSAPDPGRLATNPAKTRKRLRKRRRYAALQRRVAPALPACGSSARPCIHTAMTTVAVPCVLPLELREPYE